MWFHLEACVEAKQSYKECVAIKFIDLKDGPFYSRVKWFSLNI